MHSSGWCTQSRHAQKGQSTHGHKPPPQWISLPHRGSAMGGAHLGAEGPVQLPAEPQAAQAREHVVRRVERLRGPGRGPSGPWSPSGMVARLPRRRRWGAAGALGGVRCTCVHGVGHVVAPRDLNLIASNSHIWSIKGGFCETKSEQENTPNTGCLCDRVR